MTLNNIAKTFDGDNKRREKKIVFFVQTQLLFLCCPSSYTLINLLYLLPSFQP